MTRNLRIALYSIATMIAFFCFFYFYPAAIFEAEIQDVGGTFQHDIPLKGFLDRSSLPGEVVIQEILSIRPTWKGTLLLLIILIGIPIMIAFRIELANAPKKTKPKNEE